MVGLIVPEGWEEFFRFIGEPHTGPLWPLDDTRNVFDVLIPKLKAAAERFDMVPLPQREQFGPSQWRNQDVVLPAALEPYFLRSGMGPAFLAAGLLCRPLITTAESGGKFAIAGIEGSSHHHEQSVFGGGRTLTFRSTHHAFQVVEGAVKFVVGDSSTTTVRTGELVYVPSGTSLSLRLRSKYAHLYAFASGKGLVELLCKVDERCHAPIPPEKAQTVLMDSIRGPQEEIAFQIG